ncbi:MAG: NTP transferase domain-containing protein [Candidatus Bathyarchaeia archaeon]
MNVTALVMAGGRGTRMNSSLEKPLTPILGKPMMEYVISALRKTKAIQRIVVVTSPNCPGVTIKARELGLEIFEGLGDDYVSDVRLAIKATHAKHAMILSSDLPLITPKTLSKVIDSYKASGKPALVSCVSTLKKRKKIMPIGLNVIDGRRINSRKLDEHIFMLQRKEGGLNVNTLKTMREAEFMLRNRRRALK